MVSTVGCLFSFLPMDPINSSTAGFGARRYTEALKGRGFLCKETHTHTIRLAPPLVITEAELDTALDAVAAVLA